RWRMAARSRSRATRKSSTTARSIRPRISSMPSRKAITESSEYRGSRLVSAIKMDKRIVKYRVRTLEEKLAKAKEAPGEPDAIHDQNGKKAKVIRMTEEIQRPEMLVGSTYKIKTPISDHAMYVTINDIVLNEGTE